MSCAEAEIKGVGKTPCFPVEEGLGKPWVSQEFLSGIFCIRMTDMSLGIELGPHHFRYDYDKPSSYAFHAIVLNFFVKEVLTKRHDAKSTQLYFRLFRTGLLGDILYKAGSIKVQGEAHDVNNEMLAAVFESYLVLARSIYDYLLIYLKEQYGVEEASYNRFLKQVEKEKYKTFSTRFREHLKNRLFGDLRSLRDSVTHKTANLMIYIKDGEYRVDGTVYRDGGVSERLDESLHTLIFGYTTTLLLLMSYIAEGATGKSLSEQIDIQENENNAPSPEKVNQT